MLTDGQILQEIQNGQIIIKPFNQQCLGTNSYDVHLGKTLATYQNTILDSKSHNQVDFFEIPPDGYLLQPGTLYLGVTEEYTETHRHVPFLEGKSSGGRLGLLVHFTAGRGDVGFCNHWTLEISCIQPVRIYAGMPIAQLFYFEVDDKTILTKYNQKPSAKYNEVTGLPKESMMWKNFHN